MKEVDVKHRFVFQLMGGLSIFLFLIGCTSATPVPPPTLTLTFTGNGCSFQGPNTIPHAEFTLDLIVPDKGPSGSGFILAYLASGKTNLDISAWPSADVPPWATVLANEKTSVDKTYHFDLSKMIPRKGTMVYFFCLHHNPDRGSWVKGGGLGPIQVNK
jgi:hypothetical protein